MGFYFKFLVERYLSSIIEVPEPKYGKVEFHAFKDIPWGFKAHAINTRQPQIVEMQRIPHCLLMDLYPETNLGPRELDDGLIYIGTNFCFNHENPNCQECPVAENCEGHLRNPQLIRDYRT
jgi:hypothetical protein